MPDDPRLAELVKMNSDQAKNCLENSHNLLLACPENLSISFRASPGSLSSE